MTHGPNYRQSRNHRVRDPRDLQFQRQRQQSHAAHHPGHPLRHGLVVLLRQVTLLLSFSIALYVLWARHLLRL
jgi:hypothetical protein